MDFSKDLITPDVALVLQLRTVNDPWFPTLKTLKCKQVTEAFSPFIPLFLSTKTTEIEIGFAEDTPSVVVASTIARLSTLCHDLERIIFNNLPRDLAVIEAVSEMALACNRDTLQMFRVDSPLTEEARQVVFRLPRLSQMRVVFQGTTSLPTVALPNLTAIDVEYDFNINWLRGFHGATLDKLHSVSFRSEFNPIGDFLRAFESVAFSTCIQNTLSEFGFYTSRAWHPRYSSLLSFTQLKEVEIEFSCKGSCSSRIDDGIITSLAEAMPKLEILRLGKEPCATPTGAVTVNGLVDLARLCPYLSKLRIHFKAANLVEAANNAATPSPSDDERAIDRREGCALADLEVGDIRIPARSGLKVALILLQIFPRILNIKYTNEEWSSVAEIIGDFRRIRAFVHRSGIVYSPPRLTIVSDTQPGSMFKDRNALQDGRR